MEQNCRHKVYNLKVRDELSKQIATLKRKNKSTQQLSALQLLVDSLWKIMS